MRSDCVLHGCRRGCRSKPGLQPAQVPLLQPSDMPLPASVARQGEQQCHMQWHMVMLPHSFHQPSKLLVQVLGVAAPSSLCACACSHGPGPSSVQVQAETTHNAMKARTSLCVLLHGYLTALATLQVCAGGPPAHCAAGGPGSAVAGDGCVPHGRRAHGHALLPAVRGPAAALPGVCRWAHARPPCLHGRYLPLLCTLHQGRPAQAVTSPSLRAEFAAAPLVAGAAARTAVTFAISPLELVRVRMQGQGPRAQPLPYGQHLLQVLRSLHQEGQVPRPSRACVWIFSLAPAPKSASIQPPWSRMH